MNDDVEMLAVVAPVPGLHVLQYMACVDVAMLLLTSSGRGNTFGKALPLILQSPFVISGVAGGDGHAVSKRLATNAIAASQEIDRATAVLDVMRWLSRGWFMRTAKHCNEVQRLR